MKNTGHELGHSKEREGGQTFDHRNKDQIDETRKSHGEPAREKSCFWNVLKQADSIEYQESLKTTRSLRVSTATTFNIGIPLKFIFRKRKKIEKLNMRFYQHLFICG